LEIKFIGTGSAGNCIAIQTGGCTILIDIGIAKTKVEKALIEAGINPGEINAIFLTHAHGDHTKGLPFAEKWNIPVYASEGTWKTVDFKGMRYNLDCEIYLDGNDYYKSTVVSYFHTHHDDYDSLGFVINSPINAPDKQVSICLDTGHVDRNMIEAMRGSDIYIIEANHDPELVAGSSYPDSVKARILSDVGHLSNEQTAEALAKLVTGKGEKIYLCHLSSANNLPAIAKGEVVRALRKKGLQIDKHYFVEVV
jgi:phosphoribosyl 1,2-cyclic phosphodiesterase